VTDNAVKYRRILLKLSGESFRGDQAFGIDRKAVSYLASQIKTVRDLDVEMGVVVGGGNILRGAEEADAGSMDRAAADYAGMLGTLINALTLQDALERQFGVDTRVQSAINVQQVAEPYIQRRAVRHLEKGRVVVFACGTGNPFMTTDTAAALRSVEMGAKVMLMAKHKVDGVYSSDPQTNPDASKYEFVSYIDALEKRLGVMDSTAVSFCMENDIPIIVFDLFIPGSLERIVKGEQLGSLVAAEPHG
jgi:uridylate kinase